MAKIMLNDLLRFDTAEVPNVRVKFNIYNGYDDPLDLYKRTRRGERHMVFVA